MYRVENNVENLGLTEYFYKGGVCIIEWADMIKEHLPEERLEIEFRTIDENVRVVILKPYGDKYVNICEDIIWEHYI